MIAPATDKVLALVHEAARILEVPSLKSSLRRPCWLKEYLMGKGVTMSMLSMAPTGVPNKLTILPKAMIQFIVGDKDISRLACVRLSVEVKVGGTRLAEALALTERAPPEPPICPLIDTSIIDAKDVFRLAVPVADTLPDIDMVRVGVT